MSIVKDSTSIDSSVKAPATSPVRQLSEAEKMARQFIRQKFAELASQWRSVSYHFEIKKGKIDQSDWFDKEIMIIRPFVKNPDADGFQKAKDLGLPELHIQHGEFDVMASVAQCQRIAGEIEALIEKQFPKLD